MFLKMLVGAACAVIIAAGGYYLWGEYSRTSKTAEIRGACTRLVQNLERGLRISGDKEALASCVDLGYVSVAEAQVIDPSN